jgi:two-component system, sensor histidine kinase and response regulator
MAIEQEQGTSVELSARMSAQSDDAQAFRVSLDLVPEAALIYANDGTILEINAAAVKLFEAASAGELMGKSIYSLGVVKAEQAHEAFSKISRGEAIRFEIDFMTLQGSQLKLSIMGMPLLSPSGEVERVLGVGRDITRDKAAEREAAHLVAVVNASHDIIMNVSPEARITTWNPAAEKAYGYTAAEAIGSGIELFVPPEQLAQTLATIRHIVETGQPASWEQHARRRDGTPFTIAVDAFPIRDAAGRVTGAASVGRDITQLKRIEHELREARDYTRGLIESSVDAMVVVDRDLRITDGNEQLAKLTEVPKKILIGSRFDSYFTAPERAAAAIRKALEDGSVTNYDLVLRAASGREILVSFNASFFSRAGAISGIFGVARDVTEPRTIQRKLAEEQQYSRSLVESSPDALLVINSELVLMDVNQQTIRLTGYRREDLVGVKLATMFTDPERVTEVMRRALETGFVREVESSLLTKSAEVLPVSLNTSVFKNADGSTRGVLIGVRDISERMHARSELSLLASIVDASADAIYSESTDRAITSWNSAAERLFGYSAAEVIGRNVALLVPLAHRTEVLDHADLLSFAGKPERFETTRQRKDGNIVDVLLTRSPIFDSAHRLVGFSVIAHDIGDRKRAEDELRAARDAALEGARVKSEFLANMSHEIRTPLNSVIGMTGLLLGTQLNPEQREFANDVRDSGEALLTLINEILDFSKLASGKVTFEEIDFELTAAIEGTVDLLAEQARRKGLELTVSIDPDAPQGLRGDPGRLRQVLVNLIGNAIKFTARGGEIAVQVSKLSENPKEAILRFEVSDTGIGIPEEKRHLLFQPFSQLDASTTRHFGGTGLGLSIARQLVERMDGTIGVSSTAGSGSTFWFTATFSRSLKIARPASERFASFASIRLLIVDDNANSLQILGSQASAWKMEVETASAADHALKLMRAALPEHPFEVALIDVQMPEVDGIQLARTIKSDPELAATAVILVSSVGSAADYRTRLQGLEVGGWLTKPVPQSLLYNALVKVLVQQHRIDPQAYATKAPEVSAPPPKGKLKLFEGINFRVLLAEDNPLNQKLARFQLKKMGAEVDCVANGREAVEAVMRLPYDAVLMDCQMPEMDGYEATRDIRRLEGSHRHTPIIALTAHALAGDRDTCLAAGMDAYISKPVKPEILEEILTQFVAGDAGNAAPAAVAGAISPDSPAKDGAQTPETADQSKIAKLEKPARLTNVTNVAQVVKVAQPAQPATAQKPPRPLNGKLPA